MIISGMVLVTGTTYFAVLSYRRRRRNRKFIQMLRSKTLQDHHVNEQVKIIDQSRTTLRKRSRQKMSLLFGGTRQLQLQEFSGTIKEISQAEQHANLNFMLSLLTVGLSTSGALLFAPFYLVSLPITLFVMRDPVVDSYKSVFQEKRLRASVTWALSNIMLVLGGYFVFASLGCLMYALNRKLLLMIKDNSEKNFIDVFRQQSRFVRVLSEGVEREVPFEAVVSGDIVVVYAGGIIPVDGMITDGLASIDQRLLTGEAQAVEKEVGDEVFASTVVLSGRVHIETLKTGEESTSAQIAHILTNAINTHTDRQLWMEGVADQTVGPCLLLSGATFLLLGPVSSICVLKSHPMYSATSLLAATVLNHLNLASQKGILVKDGQTLELLSQIDTFVFDKTGTLTEEQPQVGQIYPLGHYDDNQILQYAAAAERGQAHPIARAIVQAAQQRGLDPLDMSEADYSVGYGLSVTIKGQLVQVGSARFISMEGIAIPTDIQQRQEECHRQGQSIVLIAADHQLIGAIALHPIVRPEVKATIQFLRQAGIQSIYIISGDHELPTKKLADELGLDHYFAETLPEQKSDLIEQLQNEGKSVCFVGDGINDAIALQKATVSVSLRGASTIATDTAQIILMNERLDQLCDLLDLAREFEVDAKVTTYPFLGLCMTQLCGTLFFGFGLATVYALRQTANFVGIAGAMSPLIRHRSKTTAPSLASPLTPPEKGLPSSSRALIQTT